MKTETLTDKIFNKSKAKGLIPHSITNGCVLNLTNGKCVVGKSKKDLLTKLENYSLCS